MHKTHPEETQKTQSSKQACWNVSIVIHLQCYNLWVTHSAKHIFNIRNWSIKYDSIVWKRLWLFFYIPLVCVEPTAVSRLGQQEAWSHMLQTSSVEKNADMLAGSTVKTCGASKYLIDEAWKTCLASAPHLHLNERSTSASPQCIGAPCILLL